MFASATKLTPMGLPRPLHGKSSSLKYRYEETKRLTSITCGISIYTSSCSRVSTLGLHLISWKTLRIGRYWHLGRKRWFFNDLGRRPPAPDLTRMTTKHTHDANQCLNQNETNSSRKMMFEAKIVAVVYIYRYIIKYRNMTDTLFFIYNKRQENQRSWQSLEHSSYDIMFGYFYREERNSKGKATICTLNGAI